jgi:hypothetical protein
MTFPPLRMASESVSFSMQQMTTVRKSHRVNANSIKAS